MTIFLKYLYDNKQYGDQFFPGAATKYNLTEQQVLDLLYEWFNFEDTMEALLSEPEYDDNLF